MPIISNPAADKASLTFRGFYDIFSLFLPLTAKDFPVLIIERHDQQEDLFAAYWNIL